MKPAAIVLAVVLAAIGGCAGATRPATQWGRPNIVIIVADDLGYADLGCQGSSEAKTPNIDSIATNGVRFTNGYVTCPVCSPTRAGLLTGRYQTRFGHELNPPPPPATGTGLPLDQVLLSQMLRRAGYATGMFGKWHLGMQRNYRPWERGFDEFYGFLHGQHDYFDLQDRKLNRRDPVLRGASIVSGGSITEDFAAVPDEGYLTERLSHEAVSFIERHADQPFFLYVPFNAVHVPLQSPQKYLDRVAEMPDPRRRTMLAMLVAMDDGVGQLLRALRANGLEEKTIVFFISDNGGYRANTSRNDPLRGAKTDLLEGGIRAPFLVQWKDHIPAGRVLDHPVISLDVTATAIALAHAQPAKGRAIDGVDLLPLLRGKSKAGPHEYLFWRYGQQWAVRSGNYKLVQAKQGTAALYDLSSDLREENDLSSQKPQVISRLRDAYERWNARNIPPRWDRQGPRNAATTRPMAGEDAQ